MIRRTIRLMVVAWALLAVSCSVLPPPSEKALSLHTESVLAWRVERLASLQSGDSWLTLVGLYWLQEGDNLAGSDPANAVVLPGSQVPPIAGQFHMDDSIVTFIGEPSLEVMSAGQQISSMVLQDDSKGEPSILTLGSLAFYIIQRAGELAVRVKDSTSEALVQFSGLDYYPISERWRVTARYVAHSGGGTQIAVPTFQGPTQYMASPGSLEFEIEGRAYTLDAFAEAGSDELFIVFGDRTNGRETYGGGRFIYVPRADENGMVELDFNRAYSPPCVFTPFATCPLPPAQNRLTVAVEAGEKNYHSPLHDLGDR